MSPQGRATKVCLTYLYIYIYIYIYMYIRIAFFIELQLRVSRSLRSLANNTLTTSYDSEIGNHERGKIKASNCRNIAAPERNIATGILPTFDLTRTLSIRSGDEHCQGPLPTLDL